MRLLLYSNEAFNYCLNVRSKNSLRDLNHLVVRWTTHWVSKCLRAKMIIFISCRGMCNSGCAWCYLAMAQLVRQME